MKFVKESLPSQCPEVRAALWGPGLSGHVRRADREGERGQGGLPSLRQLRHETRHQEQGRPPVPLSEEQRPPAARKGQAHRGSAADAHVGACRGRRF